MGVLNFAAGFGKGYLQETQRKEAQARQDKIDERNARTAELQQRNAELGIQKLEQERADEQALRDAASTVEGTQGFASGAPGSQVFSQDQAEAEQLAQINADAAELEGKPAPASKAVTAATGVTGGGKSRIAAAGLDTSVMNTPEARIKRQADTLRSMGRVTQATELEAKFATQQKQLYDIQRTALFDKFVNTAANEGVDAAIKLYDSYDDGFDVQHVPNGAGGVVRRMKDGKVIGELKYTSVDDLNNQVRGLIFPDKVREERIAASKATMTVKPGEQIINPETRQLVYENRLNYVQDGFNEDGSPRYVRASAGGGGGGGKKAEAPKLRIDGIMDNIFTASEKADGPMKLTPDQMTSAKAIASELLQRNDGASDQVIANVAMAVMRNPALATPRLASDGRAVRVINDPVSGQKIEVSDLDLSKITDEDKSMLKKQVPMLISKVESELPGSQGLVARAAFGDAAALQSLTAQLIKAQEEQVRKFNPKASALDVNRTASDLVRTKVMPALQAQLQTISRFGDAPRAERAPTPRTRPADASAPAADVDQAPILSPEESSGAPPTPRAAAAPAAPTASQGGLDLSRSPRSIGDAFDTPEVRAILRERVRQAESGRGEPLSRIEALRARQLGLTS